MGIQIESTTDTSDQVMAALGKSEPVKEAVEKAVDVIEKAAPADKKSEDETSEVEKTEAREDSDTSKDETSENDEDKTTDDGDEVEASSDKPKKRNGFKKRIDKLNSKLSAKDAEIEHWKAEALKQKQKEDAASNEPGEPTSSQASDRPDADDYDSHEDYIEALTDYKLEQRFKEQKQQSEKQRIEAQRQKAISTHVERVQEFANTKTDFNEVIESVDDIQMPTFIQEQIISSDNSPELMYALAKEPEQLEKICSMSPMQAVRALGRFESKLGVSSQTPTKTKTVQTTKAPKPLKPLSAGGSGVSIKSPDDMSLKEYEKWYAKNYG